jgi:hypothetical protein
VPYGKQILPPSVTQVALFKVDTSHFVINQLIVCLMGTGQCGPAAFRGRTGMAYPPPPTERGTVSRCLIFGYQADSVGSSRGAIP